MIRVCLITLLLVFPLTVGCHKTPPAPEAIVQLKLALNWKPEPEFGGFYAADSAGFYKRNHLHVEITGGGDQVPQLLAAGKCNFGILAADEVVTARSKGIDLIALFAVYQTNPQGIMCHADSSAKNIGDVMNSTDTLAVQPGLPYVDFLRHKYPHAQAKIVPYDYSLTGFLANPNYAQQCFVTSEPIAAEQKGIKTKVFLIADEGFNPYATVVVTRGDYLHSHAQTVANFISALRDGWRSYLDNPAPANQAMGKLNQEMDAPTFAAAAAAQKPLIETAQTRADGLGTMSQARWNALIKQMLELKLIDQAPTAADCFENPKTPPTPPGTD